MKNIVSYSAPQGHVCDKGGAQVHEDGHVIGVDPYRFRDFITGSNSIKVREPDNRDYKLDTIVVISEYHTSGTKTGRYLVGEIEHITRGRENGMPEGYALLKINKLSGVSW